MSTGVSTNKDPMVFYYRNHSYCDWRVTLSCEDGQLYKLLYISNLAIVCLIAIACIILLWYRIRFQGCTIFSPKIPGTGFIRPNPVEGFLVWAILWLIGRILFILILWSGKLSSNYLALETFQEVYWTCGATGCAWFVVGTYLQIGSHLNSKHRPWRPNNKLSDSFLLIMTICVPMTIWPVTVTSGYFRDHNKAKLADLLITIRYILWGLWFGFGAIGTIYFGKDLCKVLSYHISVAKESSHITIGRVEKMQSGLKKIRFTLNIITLTYLYYLAYCVIASIFRLWLITHKLLNLFMFVTYAFFNPLCIIFVVATISIRIIQSNSSSTTTNNTNTTIITKNLINNNCNNISNNLQRNVSTCLAMSSVSNTNKNCLVLNNHGLAREIPELNSITSAIAHMDHINMDQHQFDDLVAYTQFNINNTNDNSVNLNNYYVKQIEEVEKRGSGSGSGSGSRSRSSFNELNGEIQVQSIRSLEKVIVRPASPTIPIFSTNQK